MGRINAAITGVQGYVPDYILTNKELETLVDTNNEWITSRTGVKERRILKGEGKGSSDLGSQAIKGLLEKTNTLAEDIDLIICATATPDMIFPSTACIIADKVGAKNAFAYDLMAACSGFLFALSTASSKSDLEPSFTSDSCSPVAGLNIFPVLSELPEVILPFTKC